MSNDDAHMWLQVTIKGDPKIRLGILLLWLKFLRKWSQDVNFQDLHQLIKQTCKSFYSQLLFTTQFGQFADASAKIQAITT